MEFTQSNMTSSINSAKTSLHGIQEIVLPNTSAHMMFITFTVHIHKITGVTHKYIASMYCLVIIDEPQTLIK